MNRIEILQQAQELTSGERNATYGEPYENHQRIAHFWNAYLEPNGTTIQAQDVAVMMALVKISRIATSRTHEDNYVDGASYMAIAGECANKQSEQPSTIDPTDLIEFKVPSGYIVPRNPALYQPTKDELAQFMGIKPEDIQEI